MFLRLVGVRSTEQAGIKEVKRPFDLSILKWQGQKVFCPMIMHWKGDMCYEKITVDGGYAGFLRFIVVQFFCRSVAAGYGWMVV